MKSMKKRKTKKQIVIISMIGALFVILAIVMCFLSIKGKDEFIMHYSDSSNLDYNVYLKNNNFYTTPYLPKDKVYISNLINYIDASFNYNFDVVEDINLGYKYYISAKVEIQGNSDKKVFEQEEILLDNSDIKNIKDKKFAIDEKLRIDYNKYNKLASSFIDEYGISAKANLIVSLFVEVEGTLEKFENKLNDSAVVSFVIPLDMDMTDITINYDLTNNSNEVFEYGKTSIIHPWLFGLSILIALIAIVIVIYEVIKYIVTMDPKERYQERLKKIFKDYGSYISKKAVKANSKEIMYTLSLRVEMVDTFDDLINVRDSIEKPILFYESVPGEQAVFYIIDTKVSYIYIMSANDLDNKKNTSEDDKLERTQRIPINKDMYLEKVEDDISNVVSLIELSKKEEVLLRELKEKVNPHPKSGTSKKKEESKSSSKDEKNSKKSTDKNNQELEEKKAKKKKKRKKKKSTSSTTVDNK